MKLAEAHEICLSQIYGPEDLEEDRQLRSRQMIVETDQGDGRKLKGIGAPIKFSGCPPDNPGQAPPVGQDSIEILKEMGYSPEKSEELLAKGIVFAQG